LLLLLLPHAQRNAKQVQSKNDLKVFIDPKVYAALKKQSIRFLIRILTLPACGCAHEGPKIDEYLGAVIRIQEFFLPKSFEHSALLKGR
jgi:hypothetical protein